ncbi:MAG: MFS transporter [Dehalococcoidia bacterium]|jgi:MFS family permease|nr:MFS transporter [Dehalococcoidia bacterium]
MSTSPTAVLREDTRSPLRQLFTSRSFVALFITNTLAFGGEQMRFAAQSWWILDEGGSKTEMGLAAGLRVVPVVIITLYAGVLIDRVGGKRILMIVQAFLILLAIITGLILLIDRVQVWHVVVLSTIAGSTIALGAPSRQTLVPEVVPKDILLQANSMNQLGTAAGRTLGPLAAGALIAIRSAALALFGLAVVYGLALIATLNIRAMGQRKSVSDESALSQIRSGFSYIRSNPVLLWTIVSSISSIFLAMIYPIIPVYARDVLEVGEVKFGWMWGAVAVGQATGAFVIASKGGFPKKSLNLVAGVGVFGVGLIGFGLSEIYWVSLVFLFVNGLGIPLILTSWMTLLQEHAATEYRGRVMAVYSIAIQGTSAGWLLGGYLLDVIGGFPTVLATVIGSLGIVVIAIAASKDFRNA